PHVSSGVRSAGCNLIATLVFGMSETIAITGKSVKLFKGHYISMSMTFVLIDWQASAAMPMTFVVECFKLGRFFWRQAESLMFNCLDIHNYTSPIVLSGA
ncbi:MAG: hypothetical protein ACREYE_09935, partial [Gammaproteobacteria bacterium]